jgi:hypothetical protein
MRYRLAFLLVGARVSACATLAVSYVFPRDLDTPGLITPLSHCDVDIV